MTTLLAIETSCDETGVAVVTKADSTITVGAQALASQAATHALTGGVVPEFAAREHVKAINPLIKKVLLEAKVKPASLDAVAATVGPGLMPALTIGVTVARTLGFAWDKSLVPVHHLEGHIASALLQSAEENPKTKFQKPNPHYSLLTTHYSLPTNPFPALALIVSGGHTMLIKISDYLNYEVLGTTRDDAAGEAFDKVARLLNLPYPGGPHLANLAQHGNPEAFAFTRPMLRSHNLDFSFSGLKTDVLYTLRDLTAAKKPFSPADVAASFQAAVVDTLVAKTRAALDGAAWQTLLLAGGVAANLSLRAELSRLALERQIKLQIAPLDLCGDNAVMIGQAGLFAYESGRTSDWRSIDAQARIDITDLQQKSAQS